MSEDIRKQPGPRRRAEPADDPPDDLDLVYEEEPPYPRTITAAGVLLIVFGCLVLVNLLVSLASAFVLAQKAGGRDSGAFMAGSVCGLIFVGLIGAVFIQEGVRAARGTLRDTIGTGIASILFGVLGLAGAVLAVAGGGILQAAFAGMVGAMLVTAGVLALVGRSPYKLWRQWRKAQKGREAAERKARRFEK